MCWEKLFFKRHTLGRWNSAPTSGINFQWEISGSAGVSYANSSNRTLELNILSPGMVYVRIRILSGGGECANGIERTYILNAQNGNCDNLFNYTDNGSISKQNEELKNDIFDENLKLYPNPIGNGNLIIERSGGGSNRIQLMDMTGKILQEFETESDIYQISVNDLVAGVYMIKAINNNHYRTAKFIKK